MRLLRLKLENFRQHRDSDIEFRDGMTAIVGPNGSGKSTILEAITYALYGEMRGQKNTIRFYWAPPRSPARVTLEFELAGKKYVVERNELDATLYLHDGSKEHVHANGLKAVAFACEKLTGLTFEQFTNSFCAEQKQLAFLQFRTRADRQNEIARMLGYDRLRSAADLGKKRVPILKERIRINQENLGTEEQHKHAVESCKASLKQATEAVKSAEVRLLEVERALPAALIARQQGENFLSLSAELHEIRGRADALKLAYKNAETSLTQAKLAAEQLALLKPREAVYQLADMACREYDKLREAHLQREQKVARLTELASEIKNGESRLKALGTVELTSLEKSLDSLHKGAETTQKDIKAAEESWREAQGDVAKQLATLEERLNAAREAAKKAQGLIARGICPECGQSTTASGEEALKTRQQEVTEREKEHGALLKQAAAQSQKPAKLQELEAAFIKAQSAVEEARTGLNEGRQLQAKIAAEQEAHNRTLKTRSHLESELDKTPSTYEAKAHETAKAKRDALTKEHEAYLSVRDADQKFKQAEISFAEAEKELNEAKAKFKTLEEQRKALPLNDAKDAEKVVDAHKELLGEQKSKLELLTERRNLVKTYEAQLADKQKALAEYHQKLQAISTDKDELALHETTTKELLTLREKLNESIRPELSARASDNLALLTHDRYSLLKLDEDFQPIVTEDDIDKPVISGGEEDVVALSLRLALSELIQERQGRPMSLLILDEVFGSLDSERRQSVMERLSSIKGHFAQILVISHIEEINQVADQCLYVSRDGDTRAAKVTDAPPDFALAEL